MSRRPLKKFTDRMPRSRIGVKSAMGAAEVAIEVAPESADFDLETEIEISLDDLSVAEQQHFEGDVIWAGNFDTVAQEQAERQR